MSTETDSPRNMQRLTFQKSALLDRIRTNLAAHRSVYERAMDGYQTAAAVFFAEQLDRARAGKPFVTFFNEPVPEDHTEDYEAVIDLLELAVDDAISLSTQEFRQYIRDDWGWKKEFTATTSNYLP